MRYCIPFRLYLNTASAAIFTGCLISWHPHVGRCNGGSTGPLTVRGASSTLWRQLHTKRCQRQLKMGDIEATANIPSAPPSPVSLCLMVSVCRVHMIDPCCLQGTTPFLDGAARQQHSRSQRDKVTDPTGSYLLPKRLRDHPSVNFRSDRLLLCRGSHIASLCSVSFRGKMQRGGTQQNKTGIPSILYGAAH